MEPILLDIDDYIGYGNSSFNSVKAKLQGGQGRKVRVVVNGYGGNVTDGVGIYNLLRGHRGETESHIATWAYSADTIAALGARHRTMAENGFFLIHNSQGFTVGDQNDHQKTIAAQKNVDRQLLEIYHRETGLGKQLLKQMMDEERLISAKEALEMGFVHELTPGTQLNNHITAETMLRHYVPKPPTTNNQQPTTNPSNMKLSILNTIASWLGLNSDTATTDDIEAKIKEHGSFENFKNSLRSEIEKELKADHTSELQALQAAAKKHETELAAALATNQELTAEVTSMKGIITDKDKEIETLKNEGGGEHAGGKTEAKKLAGNTKSNPITARAAESMGSKDSLPFD